MKKKIKIKINLNSSGQNRDSSGNRNNNLNEIQENISFLKHRRVVMKKNKEQGKHLKINITIA